MIRSWMVLLGLCCWSVAAAAERPAIELDEATHKRCLAVLREGLRGTEFWPAMHAAEGLTVGGHGDEVIEFLKSKVATETDDQKRCGLTRELARAGDKSGIPVMLAILEGAKDYGHVHAAESLFKVYEAGDQQALRRGLAQDQNLKLKMMSAGALHRAGDKQAIDSIRTLLSHENPRHAEVAAWLIGQIGDASDVARLKAQLPKRTDPLAKAYFEHALAMLGDADGAAALVANLSHTDKMIRTYAANFAGDARVVTAAPQLIKMLDDPWFDARVRAAQSLLVLASE
jgi:sialidase-1